MYNVRSVGGPWSAVWQKVLGPGFAEEKTEARLDRTDKIQLMIGCKASRLGYEEKRSKVERIEDFS